ncbi:cytochrome C biogenesis protein [Stenotrophomonas ginsengisoli]|uniref:Cytochrome C biogenesis protein n=1 Tax=Stenotrophomonas ginsengisoli TaxID=336566 RepID=A0A0R0DKP9_9GAMM|nr:heme lyase CcmF/NrfE family subunit [Stenotrophomonas ginsengisoli]KRG78168.1 cytochrome C biogenesis protein [Stenotrophomonas ginsengisoli]
MLGEIGQLLLIAALLAVAVQASLPLLGAARGNHALMQIGRSAAFVHLLLVAAAFGVLTAAFVQLDFSLRYVADNANLALPLVYRLSAVWGAHEGSLLLWLLVQACWSAAVAWRSSQLPAAFQARVLGVLGLVGLGFAAFCVFTSNPFERLLPAVADGHDLNPLLQDPGLIFHPPMLYVGYVGFSVPFAFAIAALLEGRVDSTWLRASRPWTNVAWAFLTAGIALGSWWAYYELGWGGWWFWDPVENASFLPWLVGAALLHSQAVSEKRGVFVRWTLLLAIAAFSLSLLGAFLVRSGVLTSVHSFAADPSRGMFILAFLALVMGGALLLYALRAPRITPDPTDARRGFAANSRETLLLANNLLLTAAAAMVLLGTLYPLLADALGLGKISVGPPYFGSLFVVLMTPLVLLVPFGPLTAWQRQRGSGALRLLLPWAVLALVAGALAFWLAPQGRLKTAAGIIAALWVAGGTSVHIIQRLRGNGRPDAETIGMWLGHAGIAVFLVGALLVEALNVQRELALRPGQHAELGGYRLTLVEVTPFQGPNYQAQRATVLLQRDGQSQGSLHPERRLYLRGQLMTEAGIARRWHGDLYTALGEPLGDGAWALRLHYKPMVRWIWSGAILMALGALFTATAGRLRRRKETAQ